MNRSSMLSAPSPTPSGPRRMPPLRRLATAAVLEPARPLAVTLAQAANFSKSPYDSAKADIKATYKAERDNCGSLAGNARDICVEQAKGREAVALAQLEYNYTGKARDEQKLFAVRA